jgi:NAD(P)-dependent dehydrogenase (short-subunit alcohol dehydrogenase family)
MPHLVQNPAADQLHGSQRIALGQTALGRRAKGGIRSMAQPVPRAGIPDDIARAAVFLASDASSFVKGHDMVIDGGMAAGQDGSEMQAFRAEIGRRVSG